VIKRKGDQVAFSLPARAARQVQPRESCLDLVYDLGCRGWGLGVGAKGLGFGVWDWGFGFQGLVLRLGVQGLGVVETEALGGAEEQLLYTNVQRFRGGLVSKARKLLYPSILGLE